MINGLVIADAGPIFSLAIVDKLELLDDLFNEIYISNAVWEEITQVKSNNIYSKIVQYFETKIRKIQGHNDLFFLMDYGESESVVLYKELSADFLLLDDKKARHIAESLGINCLGTLGLLSTAKRKGLLAELKPLFLTFLSNKRFYSIKLLNAVLEANGETLLGKNDYK
ncbi:MAG: DUF3368 domain-containing protein [Nonlabens sp.]